MLCQPLPFSRKVKSKLFLICLNLDFIQLMMQRDLHPYYDRIKTKAIIHLLFILKLICPFFYTNLLHAILLLLIIIYIHQTFQILVNPLYVLRNHFSQNNMPFLDILKNVHHNHELYIMKLFSNLIQFFNNNIVIMVKFL